MDNRSQTNNEFKGFLYKQRGHFAAEAAHGCKGTKENQFLERIRLSCVLTMFEIDILSILYIHRSSEIPIPPKSPNFPFLLEHASKPQICDHHVLENDLFQIFHMVVIGYPK